MPVTVTCECGHVTELADREQPGDAAVVADQVCPICGRALLSHVPAGKRMFQQLWQSHADDNVGTPVSTAPPSVAAHTEPLPDPDPAPARRSLWEVMRGSTGADHPETIAPVASARIEDAPASEPFTADAVKPKGLWGVMHATTPSPS